MIEKIRKSIISTMQMFILIFLGVSVLLIVSFLILEQFDLLDAKMPCIISGIVGAVGILCCLIFIIFKMDLLSIKKTIAMHGWSEREIERDLSTGFQNESICVGRKYVLCRPGFHLILLLVKQVVWVYYFTMVIDNPQGVINFKKNCCYVCIVMRDGKLHRIEVKDQDTANDLVEYLRRNHQHILLGLSEEKKRLYQQNFLQLVRMSDEQGLDSVKMSEYYNKPNFEDDFWKTNESTSKFKLSSDS